MRHRNRLSSQTRAYLQTHLPFDGRPVHAVDVTSSLDKTLALQQDAPQETVPRQVHWNYALPYAIQRFANHAVRAMLQMGGAPVHAHAYTPRRSRSTLLSP